MSKNKTSDIWLIPKVDLQKLFDTSDSVVAVLRQLGFNPYNGNHRTLHARVQRDGLSLVKLKENRTASRAKHLKEIGWQRTPDGQAFCEHSTYSRNHLKKRILDRGLLEYKCSECGNKGVHNGKPLSLQLDHENGICDDNRINNLRFLCPNCHSQTETFGSKRIKKNKVYETDIHKTRRLLATRKFNPSKRDLARLVLEMPMTQVGRMFGVSDNSVRKRCRLLGIVW